jgi:hypothetical protein
MPSEPLLTASQARALRQREAPMLQKAIALRRSTFADSLTPSYIVSRHGRKKRGGYWNMRLPKNPCHERSVSRYSFG